MENLIFELLKQQAITALAVLTIAIAIAFHFIFNGIDDIEDGLKAKGTCELIVGSVALFASLLTLC